MEKATIVLPAYNEEKKIGHVLKNIVSLDNYDIIVVDDGSTDRTADVSKKYARVISLKRNMGKGYACRIGADNAKFQNLVFIDSDGQLSPNNISKFLVKLRDSDLVVGKRTIKAIPIQRKFANRFANSLVRRITKSDLGDSLCGLRAIRKKDFEALDLRKNRYEFESEMLIKAAKKNMKIEHVPVDVSYKDYSGMPITQSLRVAFYLIKEYLKR